VEISDFSVEDFVMDGCFRMWVLYPSEISNIRWRRLLRENPKQVSNATVARQIVLNMNANHFRLSDSENSSLWGAIESELGDLDGEPSECKLATINSEAIRKKHSNVVRSHSWHSRRQGALLSTGPLRSGRIRNTAKRGN
jgi:hypothetical protein